MYLKNMLSAEKWLLFSVRIGYNRVFSIVKRSLVMFDGFFTSKNLESLTKCLCIQAVFVCGWYFNKRAFGIMSHGGYN